MVTIFWLEDILFFPSTLKISSQIIVNCFIIFPSLQHFTGVCIAKI